MSWEAAASVAGPIVGGLLGQGAVSSQNRTNLKIASKQEDFQREMSDTAHQREVADLRAAGLNPLLSAGGSGASTPSGASIPVQANNEFGKGLERAVSGVMDARRLNQDMKASDAQIALTKASQATQATQAELNTSNAVAARTNAKLTAMKNSALEAQMPAIARRADADLKHADIDARWANEDAILRRTGQATGAVGNLFGVGKWLKGLGSSNKTKSYRDENYNASGEHTGSRERHYLD